jgi:peptidoglycan glycosyltransferase
MNDTRKNIRFLIFVFILLFAAMIFYLIYAISVYGERWFVSPYNPRIANMQENITAGAVLDRTGKKLAWSDGDDRKYIADESTRLAVSHVVGDPLGLTRGAETFFAKYLYGFDEDAVDRLTGLLQGSKRQGSNVTLTIDAKLSDTIRTAMGRRQGAVVLLNYETGEILSAVSNPGFDPAKVKTYKGKTGSTVLFNRAFMGRYPPGSIFKVITTAAVLDNPELKLATWDCTGETKIGGKEVSCAGDEQHGNVDLFSAFTESCNTFFARQTLKLGAEKLKKEAEKFAFNVDFMFDDIIAYQSMYETPEDDIDLAWSGVGQYKDLVSPLHAAMIAGCIANKGSMMEPRLLYSADSASGRKLYTFASKQYKNPISEANANELKKMMVNVVKEGTGTAAKVKGYTIGGKTGTAQYTDDKGKTKEHAWFIGFIDDAKHPLAIAVLLEGAGGGGRNSGPVAAKAFKKAIDLGY